MKLWAMTLAAALSLAPALAHADARSDEAKALFNAGAKAYAVGRFEEAVHYLDAAYALSPQPAILFSLSQARRRDYAKSRDAATLRKAIEGFRQYLVEVPEGPKVADAAAAVTELEVLEQTAVPGEAPLTDRSPASAEQAELIVTTAPEGAAIRVDGGTERIDFWSGRLSAGTHLVTVSAPGHRSVERTLRLVAGRPHALDISLEPLPALIDLRTASGVRVQIDGRTVGETPFSSPLEIAAGEHVIELRKNGHRAISTQLSLARAERRVLHAPLSTSVQRKAAYGLLGVGGAAVVGTAVLWGVAAVHGGHAAELNAARGSRALSLDELEDYQDARSARDRLLAVSLITLGGGLALSGLGAFLFAYDEPVRETPVRSGLRTRLGPTAVSVRYDF